MKLVRLAVAAAALVALVALAGVGLPEPASGDTPASERTITVTGSGSVTVVPDRAVLSFGVVTQGATAQAALRANGSAMRRVIGAVEAAGVGASDVQTASISLSARMSEDGTTILGYTASSTVEVTVRSLAHAGALVDAAVEAGANEVSGPSLAAADQASLYRQALASAVADARAKAATLAKAAGVALGGIVRVDEGGESPPLPLARAADGAAPPIAAGTQSIDATVTVVFAVS